MPTNDEVNIRINRPTYKRLKITAAKQGMTLKALLEMLSFLKTKKHGAA